MTARSCKKAMQPDCHWFSNILKSILQRIHINLDTCSAKNYGVSYIYPVIRIFCFIQPTRKHQG